VAILTDIPGTDLELVPAETLMRTDAEELRGIVRLGNPDVFDAVEYAAAAGTELEPDVRLLLDSSEFSLVRLPLSVRPRDNIEVRFLAVECTLHGEDGESLCWSIAPERVEDEMTVTAGATLGAGLTVGVVTVNAEAQDQRELVLYQPHITGFGLGTTDLAWELKPTRGRQVRGVQMLHFVARRRRGTRAECSVRLRLDVTTRRLLWNTVAVAEDGSAEVARFDVAPA
jgi:hypothetical protein